MDVGAEYFEDSAVRELFEMPRSEMGDLVAQADQDLRMRLLHLDVWAEVCLRRCAVEESAQKLASHVTIRPE
jgi:hypothetical protein